MDRSLYDAIGVSQTATREEIEAACLAKGAELAPLRDSDPDAARTFGEIERAFEILTNEAARKDYDLELELHASINMALFTNQGDSGQ